MMKKIGKKMSSPKAVIVLFVLSAALLLFSGINVTGAVLNRQSETFTAKVSMNEIGISLQENGTTVAQRDYNSKTADGSWIGTTSGTLLSDMLAGGENLVPGKAYEEKLCVYNSGSINEFVRVSIRRYWLDKNNKKMTKLTPDMISLSLEGTSLDEADSFGGWVKDPSSTTDERIILYYTSLLAPKTATSLFADEITISNEVAKKVHQEKEGNVITTIYDYDGVQFCLEVTADAVQENNAEDAIKSAWGCDVTVSGTSLSLK